MAFTSTDMKILISMLTATLLISFAFPAMGLADTDMTVDNIPEFNASAADYDLAGSIPEQPNGGGQGDVSVGGDALPSENYITIDSTADRQAQVFGTTGTAKANIQINYANDPTVNDSYTFAEVGDRGELRAGGYVAVVELAELNGTTTTAGANSYTFEYEIISTPESDQGLSSVPIVGDTLDVVASTIAWGISVFLWVAQAIVGFFIKIILLVAEFAAFIIGFVNFIVSNYAAVVSNAPGFAKIPVTIPGVLLSLELFKITQGIVQTIWIG